MHSELLPLLPVDSSQASFQPLTLLPQTLPQSFNLTKRLQRVTLCGDFHICRSHFNSGNQPCHSSSSVESVSFGLRWPEMTGGMGFVLGFVVSLSSSATCVVPYVSAVLVCCKPFSCSHPQRWTSFPFVSPRHLFPPGPGPPFPETKSARRRVVLSAVSEVGQTEELSEFYGVCHRGGVSE